MSKEDEKGKGQDKPKIVVDDDWKAQAQAEKEKLADHAAEAEAPAAGKGGEPRELPPASFGTLVQSLAVQTMLALGGMQDRKTNRIIVDLDLAKHHIDTLTLLEQKTKGNLTAEEKKLLDQALYETRMAYVQMAQRVAGAKV
jgi:hypothetical protein